MTLLLIVGTEATSILSIIHAQSAKLGGPFFVEKGIVQFIEVGNGKANQGASAYSESKMF